MLTRVQHEEGVLSARCRYHHGVGAPEFSKMPPGSHYATPHNRPREKDEVGKDSTPIHHVAHKEVMLQQHLYPTSISAHQPLAGLKKELKDCPKGMLLLHGYKQTGPMILSKMGKLLSKTFMERYDVVVAPDGPYVTSDQKLGWWKLPSPETFAQEHTYENVNVAIDSIKLNNGVLNEDIRWTIVGFSQGAVLAEMLCLQNFLDIDRVLLLSTSGVMDSCIANNHFKMQNAFPVLVIMGEEENVYPVNITQEHYRKYTRLGNYSVHMHDKGHVIPSKSADKKRIKQFLS